MHQVHSQVYNTSSSYIFFSFLLIGASSHLRRDSPNIQGSYKELWDYRECLQVHVVNKVYKYGHNELCLVPLRNHIQLTHVACIEIEQLGGLWGLSIIQFSCKSIWRGNFTHKSIHKFTMLIMNQPTTNKAPIIGKMRSIDIEFEAFRGRMRPTIFLMCIVDPSRDIRLV